MTEEATKMDVEVRILASSVVVTEPKPVYVEWHRGTNSIKTSIKEITPETNKVSFERKEARFQISSRFYKNNFDGTYREDENKLIFFCAGE